MSYRDSERFRKVYSYFRPVPRPSDNTYGSGVTKDYVDDLFNSLDWKQSVQYASDKNVDLTAVHTLVNDVDSAFLGGQLLVDEDRVLLRAQTNPAENGLYIWYTATSKFVRTLDSAQDSITCGATCYVDTGSFGGQVWLMESVDPITVDTSPQVWTMLVSLSGSANDVVQYFTSSLAGYVSTTGSMSFNGGDASVNETWNVGSDVFFYVSGTKGLDGSAGKVSVFGGDMVVSGNIDITDGNVEITGSLYVSGVFDIMADTIEVTGTVYATQGFSGSLTNLTDGTSFIAAGDNITVTSASNGQITITGMSSAPMLWTEVSPVVGSPGAISTTSSVVIGQFSTSSFGTDVMFYVTSSFGSPRQASVFMGDVVVSGNLGLGGDRLEITGSLAVSGTFDVTGDTVEITGSLYVSGVCDIKGDVAVSGSALLFGGVAFNVLSCSSGPGSVYYVSASTTVVVLDHGTVTAALPLNAPIGTFFIFKDGAGDASSGPKYISASLGSIDGSATTTLPSSSYSSIMVVKIGETDKWIKHS